MAVIILKNDNIKVAAKAGKTMRQIAMKSGASMEFGCRVGDCSTCTAKILSGKEFVTPMTEKEKNTLTTIDCNDEDIRLMCQCEVSSDEGEIIIEYVSI